MGLNWCYFFLSFQNRQANLNYVNEDVHQKFLIQISFFKNKIQLKETRARDVPLKSINDLYQERDIFIQFYKCLKMAEVCSLSGKKIDKDMFQWILAISKKVKITNHTLEIIF